MALALASLGSCGDQRPQAKGELSLYSVYPALYEQLETAFRGSGGERILRSDASAQDYAEGIASNDAFIGTDAVIAEFSAALVDDAGRGSFKDMRDLKKRAEYDESIAPSLREGAFGEESWFLPLSYYPWLLYANIDLAGSGSREALGSVEGFMARCEEIVAEGKLAIAMGNSHGWPMAAWFSALYLSAAGPEAYIALLKGDTGLSGELGMASLKRLEAMEAKGFFGADPNARTMAEATEDFLAGKAAFIYLPTVNFQSRRLPPSVVALHFPGMGPGLALGSKSGMVVLAGSERAESCAALAAAYMREGSPGLASGFTRVRALAWAEADIPSDAVYEELRPALASGIRVFPPFDKVLSGQAAYDILEGFRDWGSFDPRGGHLELFAQRIDAMKAAQHSK
jgi:hypothetical protein